MFNRKKNKNNIAYCDAVSRRGHFDSFRSFICAKETDEKNAFVLLETMRPSYMRYTISNTMEFLNAKPVEFTLYLEHESANELAELLAYHNMIDYNITEEQFIMIAANENNVYIYCPNVNILVDFSWEHVPNLNDLGLKIMTAFGLINAHDAVK